MTGQRRRLSAILGAGLAAIVSIGLVYWIGTGEDRTFLSPSRRGPAPVARPAYAPIQADAGQVVRAYDQLQEIYANQGIAGVTQFAGSCAQSLKSDPGVLDFCLAFDVYANALRADDPQARAGLADADARDLSLAESVLPPGADASARLAQVRLLARQTSLATAATSAPAAPASPQPAPPTRASDSAPAAHPVHAVRARARAPARAVAGPACRSRATDDPHTVFASPALREADRRLRQTYRRAVDAGVGPRRLARDQARFRAALNAAGSDRAVLARLYHRRMRALEGQIRRARRS